MEFFFTYQNKENWSWIPIDPTVEAANGQNRWSYEERIIGGE